MPDLKYPARVTWTALFIGWSADQLFYGRAPGLSFLLFTALCMTALWMTARRENLKVSGTATILLLPLFFCATMVMVRDNPRLALLNVGGVLFFASWLTASLRRGSLFRPTLAAYAAIPPFILGRSIHSPLPHVESIVDLPHWAAISRRFFVPVFRGTLLATPLLLLLGLLLASADILFARALEALLSIQINWQLLQYPWRLLLILLFSWLAAGLLLSGLQGDKKENTGPLGAWLESYQRFHPIGITEGATILFLVNGLFAAFFTVQFVYLFGGAENIRLDGYTYAAYARRGFFELVAVAVISLTVIQWLRRPKFALSRRAYVLFNTLGSLTIAFVTPMLFSASQRLALYRQAYGQTELRLATQVAIIWIGVLLIWSLAALWLKGDGFALGLVGVAFGLVVTLNLINPDDLIVRQNLAHYKETGRLDLVYLGRLSTDAIPALLEVDRQLAAAPAAGPCRERVDAYRNEGSAAICIAPPDRRFLQELLAERAASLAATASLRHWPSLHLSRLRATHFLRQSGFGSPQTRPFSHEQTVNPVKFLLRFDTGAYND